MIKLPPGLIVSRETKATLELYLAILREWNSRINLVSMSALEDAWERHILDSAQLASYIPNKNVSILDIGSGAGFPGLVLSILGYENITLVESDKRKCIFLREVIRQTGAQASVVNERIEKIQNETDYIVVRAFASLNHILSLLRPKLQSTITVLALKGESYGEEIIEAQKHWRFTYKAFPSRINSKGVVLWITNIQP